MSLRTRRLVAPLERAFAPSFGYCGRCRRPWNRAEPHKTQYTVHSGCFPLCEPCWTELTPAQRLPFYRAMFDTWLLSPGTRHAEAEWQAIESAVLLGL